MAKDKNSLVVDDAELTKILTDVQTEVDALLKTEADALSKAHPGEATSTEPESDESATTPPSEDSSSAPPAADDSASPPPPAEDAPSDSAPPADASAPPPGDDGSAPPADGGGTDWANASTNPEDLVPHFAALPLEHLKACYLAAKMALAAKMGSAGTADDGSAPPPPAPAADPTADASAPPALKGEMGASLEQPEGNGEDPLHPKAGKTIKSEKDILVETLQKQLKDQEDAMATVVTAFKAIVETPVRKSVTSIVDLPAAPAAGTDVTKLTKAEINAKVRQVIESPLKKSDRELINSFALGNVGVDKIAHLLK